MMMWLGIDDTDSLDGGCTTLVFHELLDSLPCEYGQPRLTRLWPFAAHPLRHRSGRGPSQRELGLNLSTREPREESQLNYHHSF